LRATARKESVSSNNIIYERIDLRIVTIIFFIIFRRRLRRQPRILMWIGIGFSNIFFLLYNILEPIGYFYTTEAEDFCRIHFFLVGFPGAAFLMYNFLSLVDRYLSIFHPVWYRRCVTVRLVLGIQLAAFVVLFFLMKSHYIFGLIKVECNVVHPLDRTFYIVFIVCFLILCSTGQLTIYIMIKKHLVQPTITNQEDNINRVHNTTTNSGVKATSERIILPGDYIRSSTDCNEIISPEQAVRVLGQRVDSSNVTKKDLHFVRIKYQIVSRLELEATRNVVLSIGIFLLFSSPWIISSVLAHLCNGRVIQKTNMSEDEEMTEARLNQCSLYYWAISYSRLIYLIGHFLYQFFCYVSRGKDFCAGLCQVHIWKRNGCRGTRKPIKNLDNHPQRMKNVQNPRNDWRPCARQRTEQPRRNGELTFNNCP